MKENTILIFTRNGLGQAPEELQTKLALKYLSLINDANNLPAKILFYTDGVKLACQGSPVIDVLKELERKGVELILCSTCLEFYNLTKKVEVGIVGGMPDIIEALDQADQVISL